MRPCKIEPMAILLYSPPCFYDKNDTLQDSVFFFYILHFLLWHRPLPEANGHYRTYTHPFGHQTAQYRHGTLVLCMELHDFRAGAYLGIDISQSML